MPVVKEGHSLYTMYKDYKKSSKHKVEKRIFLDICYAYNKLLMQDIINGSYERISKLGDFYVQKSEVNYNNLKVDVDESLKNKKKIFHLNNHSDNMYFRFRWKKIKSSNISDSNTVLYSFKRTWHNAKSLAKRIKTDNGHKKFIDHLKRKTYDI